MAQGSDHPAGGFEAENTGGVLSGLLAEEEPFDRRSMLRLGAWGAASVGAVVLALLANQSSIKLRREQMASADLALQSQQIQSVAKQSQNEARRLASAIDTLNGDRDRLYSRVTVLEQGLDTMTGAIARQNSAASPPAGTAPAAAQNPPPAPVVAPVATTPAAPADKQPTASAAPTPDPATVASLSPEARTPPAESKPPISLADSAAARPVEPASPRGGLTPAPELVAMIPPADTAEPDTPTAEVAVRRTEFGIDLGNANSIPGLRALWRSLLKSHPALAALRPIIAVKENHNGVGMQLRLVAGPIGDAAAAAKVCAAMIESKRACETTVFDGQRLAMTGPEPPVKPAAQKHGSSKRSSNDEAPKKPDTPTFSSLFSRR